MKKHYFLYTLCALFAGITFLHSHSPREPLKNIAKAMYNTQKVLTLKECQDIVAFIENPKLFQRDISCHLRKDKTGLACAIEYDKKSDSVFIHLKNRAKLGRGFNKTVTKSILYDRKSPSIVANAIGCSCCLAEKDLQWVRVTKNMRGIAEVITVTTPRKSIKRFTQRRAQQTLVHKGRQRSIIYKYYNQGSLTSAVIKKRCSLSLRNKLKIGCTILEGIKNLHAKGIIHLDIKPANVLIDIQNKTVSAAITDLGSAYKLRKNSPLKKHGHATSLYSPPEGFLDIKEFPYQYHKKLDMYAVGCTLYSLFHEKHPPWVAYLIQEKQRLRKIEECCGKRPEKRFTRKSRKRVLYLLEKEYRKFFHNANKAKNSQTMHAVNRIIFDMLTPVYKKRISAQEGYRKMYHLYTETS